MRGLGALCIAAASLGFGLTILRERRRHIRCLRALGDALCLLASELGQSRAPLTQLVRELGGRTARPACSFFQALAEGLAKLGEQSFFEIWSETAAAALPELNDTERESLLDAGRHLGRFSPDEQIRALERSAALLADALRREEAAYREGRKLCLALPTAAGALLVILLL